MRRPCSGTLIPSVLVSDGKGLVYELSDEKPVLLREEGQFELGAEALAHFPYRVSCVGRELKLFSHHGLTDGFGAEEFFKTLLYYYMKESGKTVEDEGKIRLCELPSDKTAEDEDSYEKYRESGDGQERLLFFYFPSDD